jgi:hypothetical protein
MARVYTVSFENVTITAVQDLISLKGSTGKTCRLLRLWLGATNTTLQTAQSLRLNVKYSSATFTAGSVGTAPTPRPVDPGDAAASFTARANDTTQGTTSGAFTNLNPQGVHNYAGWDWPFKNPPAFGLNEAIIFELLSTVSGTCAFSGGAEVEETGS